MKNKFVLAAATAAVVLLMPAVSFAATPAKAHLGKILIDTAGHGEAWYVNPQTYMRVYLGRPHEALSRLLARANYVTADHIGRLAETDGAAADATYAAAVAGTVLTPSDVLASSWYVDPQSKLRRPLATADDAWKLMRSGSGATKALLNSIPVESTEPVVVSSKAVVKEVLSADTLSLTDGKKLRILSLTTPANPDLQAAAVAKLKQLIGSGEVTLERDVEDKDASGMTVRHAFVGETNLGYELVRNGLAFHDISFPNYRHAELLIVGQIDAARLRKGFWLNESTK